MAELLVEISTKLRQRVIGRCLAALLAQTWQDYDLAIFNDAPAYPITEDPVTLEWLKRHQVRRQVWLCDGLGMGQAHNHNLALWNKPWCDYEFILRLDDDLLLNSYAIERMMKALKSDPTIAAVSGLWFEHEHNETWFSDRDVPTREQWREALDLSGKVKDGNCSNWHQRLYQFHRDGPELMDVQHLYSACLYDAEAMRRAGGWPEIYSHGVCHGEETDGTYRLYLAEHRLVVHPGVTAPHLRAPGGIRSAGVHIEHQTRALDDPKRNARLFQMPGSYGRKLSVGIWSQHCHYISGASRLTVDIIHALQSQDEFEVWPIGALEDHLIKCEVAQDAFDVSYVIPDGDMPETVDVMIGICDDPEWLVQRKTLSQICIPDAHANVLITLFPWYERKGMSDYDIVAGISKFTARQIGIRWGIKARTFYPLCRRFKPLKKKNWILVVGRIDYWKATLWLAETFIATDLKNWQLHIVGTGIGSLQDGYIKDVRSFVKEHDDRIFIHEDISDHELAKLYGQARIVWCAKGIHGEERIEETEHFGLVPVEALTAGCIPLVYDLGGHCETVAKPYRWRTHEELIAKTQAIINGEDLGNPHSEAFDEIIDEGRFYDQLRQMIYQANAKVVRVEPIDQLSVTERKRRLAVIVDSPRKKTGFSTVGKQLIPGFVEAGLDVYVYAVLDAVRARAGEFNFNFWNMETNDLQGERGLPLFMQEVRPDCIFALYDPGNLYKYLVFNEFTAQGVQGGERIPVVVYFPIEGVPIRADAALLVEKVMKSGGTAFTYSPGGVESFKHQYPELELSWAYHGLDHAPFRRYEAHDRERLRHVAGLDGKFVCGAMGVNKRVKQYDILIYTARYLKDMGEADDILFYLHTEANNPILQGYPLEWMAKHYGVDEMFMWKPDTYSQRGGQYCGAEYEDDTLKQIYQITRPPTSQGRGFMFGHYDIVSRFNCMDLYIDCSSTEGFNLPLGEAMSCGVPSISVQDELVRSEVYSAGAYMLEPCYVSTWHTGAQLALIHPRDLAQAILKLKSDIGLREEYAARALACAAQYKWQPTVDKITGAVKRALGLS